MKRHWFQIRLSTAIVLMFVASGLIRVNLLGLNVHIDMLTNEPKTVYGWPLVAVERFSAFYMISDRDHYFPIWLGLGVNIVVAAVILIVVGAILEFILHRKSTNRHI